MSIMSLTPQQRWASKQKNKGRCARCGRKRNRYSWLCDYCQAKASDYIKRYRAAVKKALQVKAKALGKS